MGETPVSIVGYEMVAPDQLLANPWNPRRHTVLQREAVRESLGDIGWVKPVIVNTTTGNLVDGHLRVEEALSDGTPTIPVIFVTMSPEQEMLMLASFDPIATLAGLADATFEQLVKGLELPDTFAQIADQITGHATSGASRASLDTFVELAARVAEHETPDLTPETGITDTDADLKSMILVYDRDDYDEVISFLGSQDGDTSSERLLGLLGIR